MALTFCLSFFSIAGAEVWKVGDTQASRNLLPLPTRILWQSWANHELCVQDPGSRRPFPPCRLVLRNVCFVTGRPHLGLSPFDF